METGGRDGKAAICRRQHGNSAPLLSEKYIGLIALAFWKGVSRSETKQIFRVKE
jgi:hypothetical protein